VNIGHLLEWVEYTFLGWIVISLLATPFIGRFLSHALHERNDVAGRPSGAAGRYRRRPVGRSLPEAGLARMRADENELIR
jgi:hypothetical protein